MRRYSTLLVAATLVLGASTAGPVARAADEPLSDNPPYKHWAAFKVGTTVTQRERVKFDKDSFEADYYPGGIYIKELNYRLLEITPEKVVVQLTVSEHGHGQITELAPSRVIYPAKATKAHVTTSKDEIETFKEGSEEVRVLGKSLRCKWVEITDKDGDRVYYHKMWTTDEVPGGIVKEIRTQKKGSEMISESEHVVVSYHRP